jgi:pimeloyl-ACP methyl ester carboxylesterase
VKPQRILPIAFFMIVVALFSAYFLTRATTNPAKSPTGEAQPFLNLQGYMTQTLSWEKCETGFECTTVRVPLDYANPGAKAITLSVVRHLARDKAQRLGSLLVNPGGPGGSGVEYARSAAYIVTSEVLKRYDIVGFDPRGVGASTPLRCLNGPETDKFVAVDGSPSTAAQEREFIDQAKLLARRCVERSGALLSFIGTIDAARDLDVLRAVLGDKKLNMLGKSYGTLLGASYAHLFPQNVGRLVLDGAVDPTVSLQEMNVQQAKAFEAALNTYLDKYAADCASTGECPFGVTREEAHATIDELIANSDTTALPSKSKRPVTQSEVILGILSSLYDSDGGWSSLTYALTTAVQGDGTDLLALADYYVDRGPDGKYLINSNEIGYAVNCMDKNQRVTIESVRAEAVTLAKASPTFGGYLAWSSFPCNYWPVPSKPIPTPLTAVGSSPILVVGTTRDPATPIQWSRGLATQLKTGHLLVFDGDGHTAYTRGSTCIDAAVDAYFLSGTLPKTGLVCS